MGFRALVGQIRHFWRAKKGAMPLDLAIKHYPDTLEGFSEFPKGFTFSFFIQRFIRKT
jgi:hypothetical protein